MVDFRSEDSFQGGMDLGEHAPDAVRHSGGFGGEVVVEPDGDFQLSQGLVTDVDPPQRVGQGAGGVSDDVGVAGIGLRRARVQVSDSPHRQAGQVGRLMTIRPGHRDGQGADRGRLVDHHQCLAVRGPAC